VCLSCATVLWVTTALSAPPDNLDRYIAQKDKSYRWRIIDRGVVSSEVVYEEMILTSQTWRGMDWHHRVKIYRPPATTGARHAFLYITGGDWDDAKEKARAERLSRELEANRFENGGFGRNIGPSKSDEVLLATHLVSTLKVPFAILENVPLQPIFGGKVEDFAVAFTFNKYLETGEYDWPLLLPMTKSAVRAMDALQELAQREWKTRLRGFVVCGGSKRGWTTWLTAASDKRVVACAPAVIDVLNMPAQMKHQREMLGHYSLMIIPYTMLGMQNTMETALGKDLLGIVDPYNYRERVAMPKMIILGTNDPFWTVDSLNLYWDDLVGEKYILYIPNKGHAAIDIPRLKANTTALMALASGKVRFPRMTWEHQSTDTGVTLKIKVTKPPERVWAFQADRPNRDFGPARWRHEAMRKRDGDWFHELPTPEKGYTALYGEALFDLGKGLSVYLCTQIRVVGAVSETTPTTTSAGATSPKGQ